MASKQIFETLKKVGVVSKKHFVDKQYCNGYESDSAANKRP
jgi:hypothetical protein